MNEYFFNFYVIFSFMVVFFALVAFAEFIASWKWLPFYYRNGFPLYRKEVSLMPIPDLAAKIPELELKLTHTMWRPSIVFRALNENEIAFRNIFGSRNAMTGLIRLDHKQGKMHISGHMYWLVFAFPMMAILFIFVEPMFVFFLVIMLGMFVLVFGIQRYHYSQIAKVIEETAVSAKPVINNYLEPTLYEPKPEPTETVNYNPEFDPYKPAKSQSGLNDTEIVLLVVLVALVIVGAVMAFLLLG